MENRTISELIREALQQYQRREDVRQQQLAKLRLVLEETRSEADRTGAAKLTMEDINAEIASYRREKCQGIRRPAR